jgi:hypothetical protein
MLASLLAASPAFANGIEPGGTVTQEGEFEVGITITEPGSSDPHDIAAPGSAPVVHYEAIPQPPNAGDLTGMCTAPSGQVELGGIPVGIWYLVIGRDNTGAIVSEERVCVPLVALDSPELPPPPPLPVAPSVAEIWRSVQIPVPEMHIDPATRGVTGLATNIWTGGPVTVPVSVQLRGYTVTGVARLVEYRFFTDEGPAATSIDAGSATAPAARHTFETKGVHRIAIASIWNAEVTLTGPGIASPIPVALGSATLQVARDYPVNEVRSVLLP